MSYTRSELWLQHNDLQCIKIKQVVKLFAESGPNMRQDAKSSLAEEAEGAEEKGSSPPDVL